VKAFITVPPVAPTVIPAHWLEFRFSVPDKHSAA
jgi:hypothetical protein